MTAVEKTKRTGRTHGSVSVKPHTITKSLGSGSHIVSRSTNTGRFVEGVRIVSKRDRYGLIKLADR